MAPYEDLHGDLPILGHVLTASLAFLVGFHFVLGVADPSMMALTVLLGISMVPLLLGSRFATRITIAVAFGTIGAGAMVGVQLLLLTMAGAQLG